ncbi:MAG: hypothetical protein KA004_18075 [Verrucomicrobiales bacterium]|nr:hypothetical protein [Verrucomicrobiales bacterium]
MPLHPRAFACTTDASYLPGALALLQSIRVHHGGAIPVYVFGLGLSPGEMAQLRASGANVIVEDGATLPFPPPGAWEAKQQIPGSLLPLVSTLFLLDADIVLTSPVGDIFALAEAGKIVSSSDGGPLSFGREYAAFGPSLPGRSRVHLNSGAVCLHLQHHWELCGLWAFSSRFSAYSSAGGSPLRLPGHGDQGTFNALLSLLNKDDAIHVLPEAEWCDATLGCSVCIRETKTDGSLLVINSATGHRQRLVHCSGPKWWTASGRRHLAGLGDKLRVFQHFASLSAVGMDQHGAKQWHIVVGVCSCANHRQRREAVRKTWAAQAPPGVKVLFFTEACDPDERIWSGGKEGDVVLVETEGDYPALPAKVEGFFRSIVNSCRFDYLFKCDDETYLRLDRLACITAVGDFVGSETASGTGSVSGGAGYSLARPLVELIASTGLPPLGTEDVLVTELLRRAGILPAWDERLRMDHADWPSADNSIISAHGVSPELMHQMHQNAPAAPNCAPGVEDILLPIDPDPW